MVLALALDEFKNSDKTFTEGGLTFLVEENLLNQTGKIAVDFIENEQSSGFQLSSQNPVGGGGCQSCNSGTCG